MTLIVRSRERPEGLVPAVRTALRGVARNEAAFRVTTMSQMMADGRARRGIFAWLLGGMAAIALLLTALGIYGVVSHETARRTREIGVRMALGASARSVLGLVLRQGLVLAFGGVLCGALGAFGMMRVMRSLPFRLQPLDPLVLGCVGLVVAAVALVACVLPARRAAQADPIAALRSE
jgi:ABC-type antimicrobial peptide transport system permease subunit